MRLSSSLQLQHCRSQPIADSEAASGTLQCAVCRGTMLQWRSACQPHQLPCALSGESRHAESSCLYIVLQKNKAGEEVEEEKKSLLTLLVQNVLRNPYIWGMVSLTGATLSSTDICSMRVKCSDQSYLSAGEWHSYGAHWDS